MNRARAIMRVKTVLTALVLIVVCGGIIDIRLTVGDIKRIAVKNGQDIVANRKVTLEVAAKSDATQAELMGFMERTVKRWDRLAKDNPELDVPKVVEPQGVPKILATPSPSTLPPVRVKR